ncbi:MAG TPA: hypothetical protein VLZ84_13110, partial [Asticcacaulis sp.]|nr:hypothetical protein [Asticcacaulis sp.]
MSSSNPNTDTVRGTRRNNTAGFVVLIALAVALAAFALYKGQAPIRTPFPEDWIIWARGTPTWAGALAIGFCVLMIGVIGMVINLLADVKPKKRSRRTAPAEIELETAPAVDLQTATRAHDNRTSESRGNLRFNAQNVAGMGLSTNSLTTNPLAENPLAGAHFKTTSESPSFEVQSLE